MFGRSELERKEVFLLNIGFITIQTVIGMTYTSVGTLLGYVGSFCGLFLMYLIPLAVYVK